MSSRRLLALIDGLPQDPEKSALWRERMDWDWSNQQYLTATLLNEIRLLRADQAAIHAGTRMDVNLAKSPAQQREDDQMRERRDTARADIMRQLKRD